MEKNRDYCFRHARMYEGYQCPRCLEEEERGLVTTAPPSAAPGSKSSASGERPAAAGAGQAPRRAESQAKSAQAEAMLLSGAAREALEMCESAIEMDRRNLNAYLVGARASRVLRDSSLEQEMLGDAIKLLRTEEYGKTSRSYTEVLKHVRDGKMVAQLAETFAGARKWPPDEALSMVRALVGRGATWEAVVVLDRLPAANRSLLTCAYSLQLSGSSAPGIDPDLLRYVKSIPASERARLLAELYEVQSAEVLAGMTVAKVREAVRTRYAEWGPEIKHLLSEEARKVASERIAPSLGGPAMGWAVRFFLGALVLAVVIVLAAGGGAVGIVLAALVAVGCGGAGVAYGRDVELKRLLPTVLPEVKEELTNREVERWAPILSEEAMDTAEEPPAEVAGPSEPCPYCTAPVPADALACPQCGKPVVLPDESAAASETAPEAVTEVAPEAVPAAVPEAVAGATTPPAEGTS